jgi:hypothetical protein
MNSHRINRSSVLSNPAPTTSTSSDASNLLNTDSRMVQVLDEADHKRCSEGNQRALMVETLDRLRELTKELEKDDWKYQKNPNVDHTTGKPNLL